MNYIALQKAQEELNLTPAEKERYDTLTAMHHLVMCMNDETAYMTWIWSVPDEASAYDLADIAKEKERLSKEREKLIKEVERVEKKLSNQGFVSKAPEKVIAEEKAKMEKYSTMLKAVEEQIERLK